MYSAGSAKFATTEEADVSPVIDRLDRKQVSRIPSHMLHPGKISPAEKKQVGGMMLLCGSGSHINITVTHGFGTMHDAENIQVHDL